MNGPPLIPDLERSLVRSKDERQLHTAAYQVDEVRTFNDLRETATRLRVIVADMDRTADEQEAAWHRRG